MVSSTEAFLLSAREGGDNDFEQPVSVNLTDVSVNLTDLTDFGV